MSRSRSMCRSPTCRIVSSRSETACCSRRSSTSAIAWTTSAGSLTRRQFHEPDAVIVRAQLGSGGLDRQPGLAGTAGTGQRECATASGRSRSISRISRSRPTKLLSWTGRLCRRRRGPSDGPGATGAGRRTGCRAMPAAVRAAARRPSRISRYSCWLSSDGSTPSSRPRTARSRSYWRSAMRPLIADARTAASGRGGRPRRLGRCSSSVAERRDSSLPIAVALLQLGEAARGRRGSPEPRASRGASAQAAYRSSVRSSPR